MCVWNVDEWLFLEEEVVADGFLVEEIVSLTAQVEVVGERWHTDESWRKVLLWM